MRNIFYLSICILGTIFYSCTQNSNKALFPDGSEIPTWFSDTTKISLSNFDKQFTITDFGAINDSTVLQTAAIQKTIDEAAKQGGGVIVIPKGVYLSGALFFKPKTSLYISEGAVLKGSDTIANYPIMPSRMEGQNIDYFPALVNAYGVDGFSISGKGTINGNGLKYWKAFWQRRKENKKCTNLEVSRPRLVFIQNSNDIQLQDVKLQNSGFWTTHIYKCNNVKIFNLHIFAPSAPVKAPSSDALDIDVCKNVLVRGCYMSVNDDAIALKGGKGPLADKDNNNGANTNVIIENCEFGFCHSCLTCGSESIHNRNIIMRNCHVNEAKRLLWLKMRGDTPQKYEYITVENITGELHSFIYVKPWSQFFDLKGQKEMPMSTGEHVTMRNCDVKCDIFFNVKTNETNRLSDFKFENLNINTPKGKVDKNLVENFVLNNVVVNGEKID